MHSHQTPNARRRLDTSIDGFLRCQASSVCRTFAAAARTALYVRGGPRPQASGLRLMGEDLCNLPGLDLRSRFLISLAPAITHISLSGDDFSLPGLAEFLAAAPALTKLVLKFYCRQEAEVTGVLLHHCKAIQVLVMTGSHLPSCMPPSSVRRLQVFSHMFSAVPGYFHAFLCTLTGLMQLQVLEFSLNGQCIMDSSIRLPTLSRLAVHMYLHNTHMVSLPWLRAQAYRELEVHVADFNKSRHEHAWMISELQHLQIETLFLRCCCCHFYQPRSLLPEVAARWAAVTVSYTYITVKSTSDMVLPSIRSQVLFVQGMLQCPTTSLELLWYPLVHQPGRKVVMLNRGQGLRVHNYTGQCPDDLAQPWELTVRHKPGIAGFPNVSGLSPSQSRHMYRVWNKSAIAAGWDKLPVCEPSRHIPQSYGFSGENSS